MVFWGHRVFYFFAGHPVYEKFFSARFRNEVMREDAHDDKQEVGPRHALMQTYVDDPVGPAAQQSSAGDDPAGAGPGLTQVA